MTLASHSRCCRSSRRQAFSQSSRLSSPPLGTTSRSGMTRPIPWERLLSSDFLKTSLTAERRSRDNNSPNLIGASSTSSFSSFPSACLSVFLTVKRKAHGRPRTGKCREQRAAEVSAGKQVPSRRQGAKVGDEEEWLEWLEALVFRMAVTFWIPLATWPQPSIAQTHYRLPSRTDSKRATVLIGLNCVRDAEEPGN